MRQIASGICALAILGLFVLDRNGKARSSKAVWIPVIWLLLAGSRNLGEWLQLGAPSGSGDAYTEGNPIDRNVLTALMVAGIAVLIGRRRQLIVLLRANAPILLYFLYCGLSSIWSDHSDVSFKRWIRALGDLVVVLVILSDRNWVPALKRLFARAGFLLLPLSVLFIRYYPEYGRAYSPWTGMASWTGVTSGKNSLGFVCLIFGLASAWRVLKASERKASRQRGSLIAHGIMVLVALWLIVKADSVTSLVCFLLACGLMLLTNRARVARRPAAIHLLVAAVVTVTFCALFLGIGMSVFGRDSTLTGRTDIWKLALQLSGNAFLGTGYESFWLGERLETIRKIYPNHVNQVHNGYLEVFLNLGWLGVTMLALVIVTGYRRIVLAVHRQTETGTLRLAYFVIAIVYNFTEAAFKMTHPVWICFLMSVMAGPELLRKSVQPSTLEVPRQQSWPELPAISKHPSLEEV